MKRIGAILLCLVALATGWTLLHQAHPLEHIANQVGVRPDGLRAEFSDIRFDLVAADFRELGVRCYKLLLLLLIVATGILTVLDFSLSKERRESIVKRTRTPLDGQQRRINIVIQRRFRALRDQFETDLPFFFLFYPSLAMILLIILPSAGVTTPPFVTTIGRVVFWVCILVLSLHSVVPLLGICFLKIIWIFLLFLLWLLRRPKGIIATAGLPLTLLGLYAVYAS